jgi:membrane protein
MSLKSYWTILKDTVKEFGEDNVLRLSAALAYYSIFSIGPLLVIVVGLAGLAFGASSVKHQIEQQLQGMLGESAAKTVVSMMAAQKKGTSLITTIVGVIMLLFGAAGVFGQLQDSLNTIWGVKSKPGTGIWNLLRTRFLSFSMVLGIGFLLLVSMALSMAIAAFTGTLEQRIPMGGFIAHALDFVISFGVTSLLFAMIFKFLPDVRVPWNKVWFGAITTTLLFTIGKVLLGLYLGRQGTTSTYGAAGSVVVVLLWVYYASVILFFGAEFTQVYARRTGAVRPRSYAVPVTAEARAQQGMVDTDTLEEQPAHSKFPVSIKQTSEPRDKSKRSGYRDSPVGVVQRNAMGVVSLMLAAGFIAGTFWQFKGVRRALKVYRKIRKTAEAIAA